MVSQRTQSKDTVTLHKQEYLRLKQQAQTCRSLVSRMFESPLRDPIDEVVADFRATGLYTDEFLADLEDGLRKSSYAKRYGDQTLKKRS